MPDGTPKTGTQSRVSGAHGAPLYWACRSRHRYHRQRLGSAIKRLNTGVAQLAQPIGKAFVEIVRGQAHQPTDREHDGP